MSAGFKELGELLAQFKLGSNFTPNIAQVEEV